MPRYLSGTERLPVKLFLIIGWLSCSLSQVAFAHDGHEGTFSLGAREAKRTPRASQDGSRMVKIYTKAPLMTDDPGSFSKPKEP
jgi:hypothetical protein